MDYGKPYRKGEITSTVTQKGQVTIPKPIRDIMGIDQGSELLFVDDGDKVIVEKVNNDLEAVYGAVKHEGGPIDFDKLREQTKKAVAEKVTKDM